MLNWYKMCKEYLASALCVSGSGIPSTSIYHHHVNLRISDPLKSNDIIE